MTVDVTAYQDLLDEATRRHRVPAASLAVLADGEVTSLATGVLHRGTGVQATPDALFQIGSITKVYTTTLLMQLVADGKLELDTRVAEVLPDFRVADAEVARQVTVQHLLTHTSGIDGDLFTDTGRGDDCLERYVRECAGAAQIHPLDATLSYCNLGFVVAGRMVEVLTGQVWDTVLRERLLEPLGLTHTATLPEDVLRFRAAMGHQADPGEQPEPAPVWGLPRSVGPAGVINARAADVVAFARMHLDGGRAPDGTQVLPTELVEAMSRPLVDVPNPYGLADHWGLGWFVCDWDGRSVYGHDGSTVGQNAFLRIDPGSGVAVALLTNGGQTHGAFSDVFSALFDELCGITVPTFTPPPDPLEVDGGRHAGVYERHGVRITVTPDGARLTAHTETTGELAELSPSLDLPLVPVTEDLWATRAEADAPWSTMRFYELADGARYVHFGARATPRTA